MCHLGAAGVQSVAVRTGKAAAACQHIGVLLVRCHFKDSAVAIFQSHSIALFPLCRIVQLYHALCAAGSVHSHSCTGRIHAECVVCRRCQHIAAGNGKHAVFVQRKAAVTAGGHRTAGDVQGCGSLHGIIARLDADFAGQNGNVLLGGFQTVCGRSHGHRSTVYFQCIICPNGIGIRSSIDICVDADVAAVQLDVVLGTDRRVHAAGDVQGAGAVLGDGNVTVAVDDTAGVGVDSCRRVSQSVDAGAGQLQLPCTLSQNAGSTGGRCHGHAL